MRLLKSLSAFFRLLSVETVLSAKEAVRAMKAISESPGAAVPDFVPDMLARYREGDNVAALFRISAETSRTYSVLRPDARRLLLSFADAFGKKSLGFFGEYCLILSKEFGKMYEDAQRQREKNGGLIPALCLLSGAVLIVIFM